MLQMFGLQYIFFSFTQLNKTRIFLLKRFVWLSFFCIIRRMLMNCFLFRKKKMNSLFKFICFKEFFFSIWVFFHNYSRITGLQGKEEGISLTPHYHFHLLNRHLDISRLITAESSPLHIGSSQTRTGNLWFPSASC